jgi:hypothetical protein
VIGRFDGPAMLDHPVAGFGSNLPPSIKEKRCEQLTAAE